MRTWKRARENERAGRKEKDTVSGYIPQGCDSRTMYGYWAAGGIDSHDEGATDHPETETPAVPASPASLLRVLHPPPPLSLRSYVQPSSLRFHTAAKYFIRKLYDFPSARRHRNFENADRSVKI